MTQWLNPRNAGRARSLADRRRGPPDHCLHRPCLLRWGDWGREAGYHRIASLILEGNPMQLTNPLLIALISLAGLTQPAEAHRSVRDGEDILVQAGQAEESGTIQGQLVLPAEAPDGFRGGKLAFEDAVLVIEGMYRGPSLQRPSNYKDMSKEERQAWFEEYRESEAYKEIQRKRQEAYEARPVMKFPVEPDGSFTVKGLKLARYNVIPVFPHPDAKGKDLTEQSWGSAFKQIVLSEDRKFVDVGKMELKLKNVVMPGEVAPSWTAQGYDGKPMKSSDFRGQYLLVDLWATWCAPCIAEIPSLEKAQKELGGEQLAIIGLSLDDTMDLPREFLVKRPSDYLQGYLGQWNSGESMTAAFGVTSIPSIWLIGPDGRVVARDLRGEDLVETVRKAMHMSAESK